MKRIPVDGLVGRVALREAATSELNQMMNLVRAALQVKYDAAKPAGTSYVWFDIEAMYADKVIVCKDGRYWQYDYTIDASNNVQLAEPKEVIEQFLPVALKESLERERRVLVVDDARSTFDSFLEAVTDLEGKTWDVVIIRAGVSRNGNYYSDAVLREAVPLFDGVKVYAKSNERHLEGASPDIKELAGWISDVKFAEGRKANTGELRGRLNISGVKALRETMADAWKRGKKDLVGLSIDAIGKSKKAAAGFLEGAKRIADSITKVQSVDLIVDPSAGGALVRLVEAADPKEQSEMKLRESMQAKVKAKFPQLDVAALSDDELEQRYAEALKPEAPTGDNAPVTREELRMAEARNQARAKIAGCGLPQAAREKLQGRFDRLERFVEADVVNEIKAEREYLAKFAESGRVDLGDLSDIQVEDRSKKMHHMMDAFFNPGGKDAEGKVFPAVHSFKECYIEFTGDKRVTGRLADVDRSRLAEAVGGAFRESLDSTSFSNALGTSITRRMTAEFRAAVEFDSWRQVASVVPVSDFRTQDRVNIGGYGDLPVVAQGAGYLALASPTDAKATYSIAKRGGTEDVTLEMIKNDDVGAIRRIPVKLGRAAKRTLAKFVFDFFRTNPAIYDAVALFHATHNNLGSTALAAAEIGVIRVAMMKQTERDSADRLGIGPKGIMVPVDIQEAAWNIFQRNTNLDKTFIQNLVLDIIPVWYWTDTNDYVAYANPMDIPGLEIGFLDGQEEPDLFVQDMPNVGSMFTNDKVTYKLRHIYGGTIVPDGFKAFYKEVV